MFFCDWLTISKMLRGSELKRGYTFYLSFFFLSHNQIRRAHMPDLDYILAGVVSLPYQEAMGGKR